MKSSFILVLLLALLTSPRTTAAAQVNLVVVGSRDTLAHSVRLRVRKQFETALARDAVVLASDTFVRAALASQHESADFTSPDILTKVGAEIGATHVVVLQGNYDKRRHRNRPTAIEVSLFSVATGTQVFSEQLSMGRRRPNQRGVDRLTELISARVSESVALDSAERSSTPSDSSYETAPVPSSLPPTETEPTERFASSPIAKVTPAMPWVALGNSDRGTKRWQQGDSVGLRMSMGGGGFQRQCSISSAENKGEDINYRTDGLIPALATHIEFFPGGFGRSRSVWGGLGFHARGRIGRVVNWEDGNAPPAADYVWSADGGVTFRTWFGGRNIKTWVTARLGYAASAFPVSSAHFPSIGYSGPQGDLQLALTVADAVTLFGEGGYLWTTATDAKTAKLGALDGRDNHRLHGQGGLTIRIGSWETTLMAQYEQLAMAFKGQSALPALAAMPRATVSDRVVSGWLYLALLFQ